MTGAASRARPSSGASFRRSIRPSHAVALYVSSVLGSGILVLPGLTARLAGPASLLAWALLAGASVPLALTFSGLSARRPEAGGIYGFVREAFGVRAAAVTGWLIVLWSFTGGPAVTLIAASYLGYAFPLSRPETFLLAFAVIGAAFSVNYRGITLSSRVQLGVVGAIVALLALVVLVAGREVRLGNFTPFAPEGLLPVGTAAAFIFWSFLGYENVSSVAAEFVDPVRDFRRSVLWSVALVAVLYLSVAFVTVGTGAYRTGGSVAPFAAILGGVFGPYASEGTALFALFIVFAVVNAYTAGMSRVVYAAALDGALPGGLGWLDPDRRVPTRAMGFLLAGMSLVLVVYYFAGTDLSTALLTAGGAALITYALGSAAGLRLLPPTAGGGRLPWLLAGFSLAFSLVLIPFVGWPIAVSLVGATVAYLYASRRGATRRRAPGTPPRPQRPLSTGPPPEVAVTQR